MQDAFDNITRVLSENPVSKPVVSSKIKSESIFLRLCTEKMSKLCNMCQAECVIFSDKYWGTHCFAQFMMMITSDFIN